MTPTDVFLSYKRTDQDRVAPLHAALTTEGLRVFWDREIPGGEPWRDMLNTKLEEARCVVVVWSTASTSDQAGFVHDEASRALARGVLLPVRIDAVDPPLGFGEVQTLDLTRWQDDRTDPRFQDVVAAIRAQLEGRPRPTPRWPAIRQRRRQLAWAVGAPLVAALTLSLSADARRATCRIPGIHSACALYGVGGVPTVAEREQWRFALDRTDGEGLRRYLEHYPQGAHAAEAHARLAACREVDTPTWVDQTKPLPLVVRSDRSDHPTEPMAREDARTRAPAEVATLCQPYTQDPFRLLSTSFEVDRWLCASHPSGWSCGFDGQAACHVQARQTQRTEVCRDPEA